MFNGWLEMFEKRELDKKGGGGGEKRQKESCDPQTGH